jgi:hypothetical protein
MNCSFPTYPLLQGISLGFLKIFSIAGVLTSLCYYKLRVENLDKLVIIMKNWSFNTRANCMRKRKCLDDFLIDEANIIDDNNVVWDEASYCNGDELE